MKFLSGQEYDGTSVMSVKLNGEQLYISQKHLHALYIYCATYNLNSAITDTCSIAITRNYMAIILNRFLKILASLPVTSTKG
jgi:hypothetical protein